MVVNVNEIDLEALIDNSQGEKIHLHESWQCTLSKCTIRVTKLSVLAVHRPFYISIKMYICIKIYFTDLRLIYVKLKFINNTLLIIPLNWNSITSIKNYNIYRKLIRVKRNSIREMRSSCRWHKIFNSTSLLIYTVLRVQLELLF